MAIFLSNMALPMLDASCYLFFSLRPLVRSLVSFSNMALPTTDLNSVDCHFPIQRMLPVICFLLCGSAAPSTFHPSSLSLLSHTTRPSSTPSTPFRGSRWLPFSLLRWCLWLLSWGVYFAADIWTGLILYGSWGPRVAEMNRKYIKNIILILKKIENFEEPKLIAL